MQLGIGRHEAIGRESERLDEAGTGSRDRDEKAKASATSTTRSTG